MLRSNLRKFVKKISVRFQGASPAELNFYLRYWGKTRRLAKELEESIDPSRLREVTDRNVDAGGNPEWDKYLREIAQHLLIGAYHIYELGLDRGPERSVLDIGCGAGFFLYSTMKFGHAAMGADIDDVQLFNETIEMLGVERIVWRIEPYEAAPDFGRKFDLVTAFALQFDRSGCEPGKRWTKPQWKFFLEDLARNHLNPHGQIYVAVQRFKGGTGFNVYDDELFDYFASMGASFPRKCRVRFRSLGRLQSS
jgi:SAM-dependent methyltransferase